MYAREGQQPIPQSGHHTANYLGLIEESIIVAEKLRQVRGQMVVSKGQRFCYIYLT
jgi:hypothetical protein